MKTGVNSVKNMLHVNRRYTQRFLLRNREHYQNYIRNKLNSLISKSLDKIVRNNITFKQNLDLVRTLQLETKDLSTFGTVNLWTKL